MFQYTTETIINSEKGKLIDGSRFGVFSAAGSENGTALASGATAQDFLLIDGVNSFVLGNIKKIYKSPFRPEAKATATLDLTSATMPSAKKVLRLTVVLREQGTVRSSMQNAYLHKSKPFHYEIEVPAANTAASVVAALAKLVNKDMSMTDFNFFKASTNDNKLVLTADDCYIQFVDVKLEEVLDIEDNATPLGSKLLGTNVVKEIAGLTLTKTAGDEGAGTVTRLVKNLRIPTGASINPFAADQGGRPVPGGEYDQYLIEYETNRRHVSGGVVGSAGEVSLTSHVIFINKANAALATAWDKVLDVVAPVVFGASKTHADVLHAGKQTGVAPQSTADKNPAMSAAAVKVGDGSKSEVTIDKKKVEMGSVE